MAKPVVVKVVMRSGTTCVVEDEKGEHKVEQWISMAAFKVMKRAGATTMFFNAYWETAQEHWEISGASSRKW